MSDNILFEIKKLNQSIYQILMKGKNLKQNPSPTQMRIVRYMMKHKNEEIYQKDLENYLNISRSTISDVLNTMEKNNLIKRTSDTGDARTKKVYLTDTAILLNKKAKQEIDDLTKKISKNISGKDMKTFQKVIKQMRDNLDTI